MYRGAALDPPRMCGRRHLPHVVTTVNTMVKMMPAQGPASCPALTPSGSGARAPLTLSPNGSGIHFFQVRVKTATKQDSFAKEISILVLAGAGGFEPPRRGIKIH
jgi:hypothetical protein